MKRDSATRMQEFYEAIRENTKQRKIGLAKTKLLAR